ncbi:hypothetical protein [uncultured Hydrogenophaga sp.]|nr:hypothetical protein [uncultured Hydrogenophaga sp.]
MNGNGVHLLRRLAVMAAVAAALLATLTLYTRPDFMVHLADQLWSCF